MVVGDSGNSTPDPFCFISIIFTCYADLYVLSSDLVNLLACSCWLIESLAARFSQSCLSLRWCRECGIVDPIFF